MLNSKELALKAAKILDEKGANDIEILEVAHLTSITDYFVITNGRNIQSVRSLAEDLEDKLTEEGIEPRRKEGERESKWIVLDYAHVIVHIFHPEERKYYNIERLWQDGTNQVQYIPLEAAQKQD
ncbi:MAG: ribosome silencing factor [Eubacteriales bacterium]|nr:ribosome silencing factor [Eubacteriales bacterium]